METIYYYQYYQYYHFAIPIRGSIEIPSLTDTITVIDVITFAFIYISISFRFISKNQGSFKRAYD